jgi:hypothetical protein
VINFDWFALEPVETSDFELSAKTMNREPASYLAQGNANNKASFMSMSASSRVRSGFSWRCCVTTAMTCPCVTPLGIHFDGEKFPDEYR